jgi:CheY-like chemotaxis protein
MKLCLVVATSKDKRRSVCQVVESLGFLCAEAEDGNFAYVAVQALMPDIIIIDCASPEDEASSFVEKIRNLKKGGHPVMLLCVDELSLECAERALKAGDAQILMKPFDLEEIAGTFDRLGLRGSHGVATTNTVQ